MSTFSTKQEIENFFVNHQIGVDYEVFITRDIMDDIKNNNIAYVLSEIADNCSEFQAVFVCSAHTKVTVTEYDDCVVVRDYDDDDIHIRLDKNSNLGKRFIGIFRIASVIRADYNRVINFNESRTNLCLSQAVKKKGLYILSFFFFIYLLDIYNLFEVLSWILTCFTVANVSYLGTNLQVINVLAIQINLSSCSVLGFSN